MRVIRFKSRKGGRCALKDCPIWRTSKKNEVPYSGNKKAKLVMLGESPGPTEIKGVKDEDTGRLFREPFIGDSGLLLRKNVRISGLKWADFFVMNAARCRVMKDELQGKEITAILNTCRQFVTSAIHQIKPKAILVLGDLAMRQILRRSGITKSRATWFWSEEFDCWVMPAFHPAYILRNKALEPLLLQDLRQVYDFVHNAYQPPSVEEELDVQKYIEVQSISKLLENPDLVEVGVGIDTEGQGLDWVDPNYIMIDYSISFKDGTGVTVRLFEECPPAEADMTFIWPRVDPNDETRKKVKVPTLVGVKRCMNFDQKLDELGELLASNQIKKYFMNGSFDIHVIRTTYRRERGQVPEINRYVMDIQAGAQLLDENVFQQASLVDLQRGFTDLRVDYDREFVLKYGKEDMLSVPLEDLILYAGADADVTRRVGMDVRQRLMEPGHERLVNYLIKFVMPSLQGILFAIEEHGSYIDPEKLPITVEEVDQDLDRTWRAALKASPPGVLKLEQHVTKGLKLTRTDLVRDILFHRKGFHLKPIKTSKKSGLPSCDKETRKMLLDQPISKKATTFLQTYSLWSELHTLQSRYLRGFGNHIRCDGRIHSSYGLTMAVTGRANSSSPNMMNNPKRSKSAGKVRQLVCAAPGYILLAADQEQSELRWAAHVSKDPNMLRVFQQGQDIHEMTARQLAETPWEKMDKKERDDARFHAKAVNFGLLFLMTVRGFVRHCFLEYGIVITEDQAQEWVDLFFATYYRLPIYHEQTIEFVREHGYVEHCLGRRRRLPDIHSRDRGKRREAERMAVNHPIQGPSSDVVLMSGNEILEEDLNPEEFRPTMFVHDELVFEVAEEPREATIEDYARLIRQHMENPPLKRDFGIRMLCPLKCGVSQGYNLNEMKEMNLN